MISRIACVALLAFAASLGAQAPTTAPAPKPPKGPSKAEFRIGGFMVQGERNSDFYNSVSSSPGSIKGVEVLLRSSGIGLYARSLSGEFDGPIVISADARVLLFPPVFTIFAGVGKRGISGVKDKVFDFVIGGVSSTVNIGGSGLRTHISAGMMIGKDKQASSANAPKGTGIEAEAAIFYRVPRVPLFFTVGYRTETFTSKTPTVGPPPGTIEAPEEVRGLRFGAGIQFGGH